MKIDDTAITAKLTEIRLRIGGNEKEFVPRLYPERIDVELEGKSVTSLFHPSGLLIQDGRPVFAYIRDHIIHFADNPHERNKVHFTVCQHLTKMKAAGRWARYQVTNRDDNQYLIEVNAGWRNSRERLATLYPCQFCLDRVGYHCFVFKIMTKQQRLAIVESFDAKTALDLLWQHFDIFRLQVKNLRSAVAPAGYADNHREFSRAYRTAKNFICEECRVNLKRSPRLADAHHIDGIKNNNRDENLRCLCKLCHKKEHSHYPVKESDRREIEKARKQQNISVL